jgi:PPOX class probable F420-dependent enzyme
MDIPEAVEFAKANTHTVLVTHRSDGEPQLSPVLHAVDGEGRVMISTREPAMKVRNIRRNPRVSMLVLPDSYFGQWAQLDGPCEIIPLPEAMPLLEEIYRQDSGEHPDWDEYRRDMEAQHRVVLRVTPDRAGPTAAG